MPKFFTKIVFVVLLLVTAGTNRSFAQSRYPHLQATVNGVAMRSSNYTAYFPNSTATALVSILYDVAPPVSNMITINGVPLNSKLLTNDGNHYTALPTTFSLAYGLNKLVVRYPVMPQYVDTLFINRAYPAKLSLLSVTDHPLLQAFNSDTLNYSIDSLNQNISSIKITALSDTINAIITANGIPVASGGTANVPVSPGNNTIKVSSPGYDYVISAYRKRAAIDALSANISGQLSPVFNPGNNDYTLTASMADSVLKLTPVASDGSVTIKVTNSVVASGSESPGIPLSYGDNTIHVSTLLADSTVSNIYTIKVTRPKVDSLTNITLSEGTLSPQFSAKILTYNATVPLQTTSITITPTANDATATITVNDTPVTSGSASADIPLQLRDTPVKLVITSTQGSSQTYNLTLTHTGTAALLSSLASSIATDTEFNSQIFTYTATVFDDVHNVILTPTAAFADAKIQINGSQVTGGQATTLPLANGKNAFSLTVTGAGDSVKTYTLTINRLLPQTITFGSLIKIYGDADFAPATASTGLPITYESSDENVAAIADGQIHINGAGTVTITASQAGNDVYQPISVTQTLVVKQVQHITFIAQTKTMGDADFDAAVSTTGLPLTYKSSNTKVATIVNGKVHLIGTGTVTITASQPGNDANAPATAVTSTITVIANPLSQAQLLNLETNISSIIFAPATYSYSATVIDEVNNITLKPTAAFAYATIKINGNGVENGALTTVPLAVGSNTITMTIKGTDATVKTYTITVNRVAGTTELTGIILDAGTLSPAFDPLVHNYNVLLDATRDHIAITPLVADKILKVTVGNVLYNGSNSVNVPLLAGNNAIPVTVSKAGEMDRTYYVNVYLPLSQSTNFYNLSGSVINGKNYATVPSSTTKLTAQPTYHGYGGVYIAIGMNDGPLQPGSTAILNYGLTKIQLLYDVSPRYGPRNYLTFYYYITRLQPQTITLEPQNKYPWDKDFAPATSTTQYPITYTSSNPSVAIVSGGKIHITGIGTTAITATQFGNAGYDPASATQTLTVGKKTQLITFAAQTKTLADKDFTAATTSSKLALVVTSSNPKVATVVNGKIHLISVGTTTITASQAGNDTYNEATLSRTLTVTQSAQTISFADGAKNLAETDFVPATVSSKLPIVFTSSNTKVATIINGKVHLVGAGTTIITASQAGNTIYTPVTQSQDFTVSQAGQTIAFVTQTKTYGDADFLPATTTSGLPITYSSANWDIASIVNGRIHIEKTGTVTIWADQPGSKVYSVAESVSGTITINKAPQTITFAALNKNWADVDFAPATVNSKLPLTYTSSNTKVATVVNGKIHLVGLGTATITALQKGNENYIAANASKALTVSKASQTITLAAQTKTIGDADFSPATISSALTITYTSSDNKVATIVKGKVHIVGAGTTTITASQTGDGNYTAAKSVAQTLTVSKALQTITFAATAAKTYGDADFNGAAASSKLTVAYNTSNSEVATIVNGKIHIIAAGTVTITASQAGNDVYAAAKSVSQKLTIAKAKQTVTFAVIGKTYGDADFVPAKVSTGLPLSYILSDAKVASIVKGKLHIVSAGSVSIVIYQEGNGNYDDLTLIQKFTIAKAALTITADNKSKKAGAANPALTVTYKGFVNGDDKNDLTTQPKLTTTAITSSKAGSYVITASSAAAKNYTIAYVAGKLTVSASAVKTNSFDIDAVPQPVVTQALSPNGDGLNDVLTITNIKSYPDNSLTVMDVNGNSVYEVKGYDNQERVFDGHSSKTHAMQKQGTYYYILQYKDGDDSKRLTGYIIMKY